MIKIPEAVVGMLSVELWLPPICAVDCVVNSCQKLRVVVGSEFGCGFFLIYVCAMVCACVLPINSVSPKPRLFSVERLSAGLVTCIYTSM